jgi:hypothetical protein
MQGEREKAFTAEGAEAAEEKLSIETLPLKFSATSATSTVIPRSCSAASVILRASVVFPWRAKAFLEKGRGNDHPI